VALAAVARQTANVRRASHRRKACFDASTNTLSLLPDPAKKMLKNMPQIGALTVFFFSVNLPGRKGGARLEVVTENEARPAVHQ